MAGADVWLEGGKRRVDSAAWIGRNARESTLRGKWEYPGSSGASGPVIVTRLPPWGNGTAPRKNDAPGPGNRFQLAKLPRPRTFLRVPFTSRGPRATDRPRPPPSALSFLHFNWQNSRNAWTVLVTAARRRLHPPNPREIESNRTTIPGIPSGTGCTPGIALLSSSGTFCFLPESSRPRGTTVPELGDTGPTAGEIARDDRGRTAGTS